jgi:hypothetical protein
MRSGVCIGLALGALAFALVLFGFSLGLDSAAEDCNKVGAFHVNKVVYQCSGRDAR